jgi:hypothetical protein
MRLSCNILRKLVFKAQDKLADMLLGGTPQGQPHPPAGS